MFIFWELHSFSLSYVYLLSSSLFFMCLYKISFSMNNTLIILLCLEGFSLLVFLIISIFSKTLLVLPLLIFIFLVLAVCEAATGLCLLIRLSRSLGNDKIPI